MPDYDSKSFDPPAPVAYVTLRHPATGASLSEVPMLMDTGADVSLLPREVIVQLDIEPVAGKVYELQGFDGEIILAEAAQLGLIFLGRKFTGQFPLINQSPGIMGRNILNAISLLLDGPHGKWDEQTH